MTFRDIYLYFKRQFFNRLKTELWLTLELDVENLFHYSFPAEKSEPISDYQRGACLPAFSMLLHFSVFLLYEGCWEGGDQVLDIFASSGGCIVLAYSRLGNNVYRQQMERADGNNNPKCSSNLPTHRTTRLCEPAFTASAATRLPLVLLESSYSELLKSCCQ